MPLLPADPQQRQNVLLALLLLALAGYLEHEYLYKPRAAEAATFEARLANLGAHNQIARALVQDPDTVERELAFYRDQLPLVESLIPSSEEVPDLLDAISLQAERLGVEVSLIRPSGATAEEFYTRRTYDLAVLGSYHQIGEFLTRVASLPRIITPVNLTLTPWVEANRGGETGLEATFSIETYVLPIPASPADATVHK